MIEVSTSLVSNGAKVIVSNASQAEIDWLNDYHEKVHTKLAPILEADDLHWLERSTQQVA